MLTAREFRKTLAVGDGFDFVASRLGLDQDDVEPETVEAVLVIAAVIAVNNVRKKSHAAVSPAGDRATSQADAMAGTACPSATVQGRVVPSRSSKLATCLDKAMKASIETNRTTLTRLEATTVERATAWAARKGSPRRTR